MLKVIFDYIFDFIKNNYQHIIGTLILAAVLVVVLLLLFKTNSVQNNTKRICTIGVLAAVSSVLMFLGVSFIPGFTYLKVELSVLVIFLVYIWFDFKAAVLVSLISNVLDGLIKVGESLVPFMDQGINFVATMIFLIPLVLAFRKRSVGEFSYDDFKRKDHLDDVRGLNKVKLIVTATISLLLTSILMVIINILIIIPLYDSVYGGAITGSLKSINDNFFLAVLSIFGVFNLIHWGIIALTIIIFGNRLSKLKQYI